MVLGFVGFFGTIVAPIFIMKFKRRTLFHFGHIANMIEFLIAGYAIRIKSGDLVLACLYSFSFTYCISNGSLFWLYVAEITVNDKAMGMTAFIRMMTLFVLSISTLPVI